MNVLIRKADAVRIAGSEEELQHAVKRQGKGYCGEVLMCRTGAKLCVAYCGAVRRYKISGYSPSGSDVQELLDALKGNDDSKLRW